MYITYISVSNSTPLAVTSRDGQLASDIFTMSQVPVSKLDFSKYAQSKCLIRPLQYDGGGFLGLCRFQGLIAVVVQISGTEGGAHSINTICFVVLLSIGGIGGADRTFACKSQVCLWQDWYISMQG